MATAPPPPAWRQLPFFDLLPVHSAPDIFKSPAEISCLAHTSTSHLLLADIHGSIHLLDRDFHTVNSWVAHVAGRVTHIVERRGVIVTLGEESSVRQPLLKVWDLTKTELKTGAPLLIKSVKVQVGSRPHPVTTVALTSTLSYLAIGLGDGTVLLYRHLEQHLTPNSAISSLPKPRTVHEGGGAGSAAGGGEPVTGLGFREPSSSSATPHEDPSELQDKDDPHTGTYLFLTTPSLTLCYQISGKPPSAPVAQDDIGCSLNCAGMHWRGADMVVAREDAIYLVGVDGREGCWAYEGPKASIHSHKNYLVIVSPPLTPAISSTTATMRNTAAARIASSLTGPGSSPATGQSTDAEVTKLAIFDPENKLLGYTGMFGDGGIREVFSMWGNVWVLTIDGKLHLLKEKSTSEKLSMLYSRALYKIGLNLASSQNMDAASVADIHRQYGDYLYERAEYDAAMAEFVKTIGEVQPSYVIRKFLDAQRIHNLVTYLQELHARGLANADHTTLLLNAYTKLKDVSRLDNFIKSSSSSSAKLKDGVDALPFDLDTAIRVCRQAGYFDHASYLAKKYERHEDYLRIQIEDAGMFKEALEYLRMLGPEAAESNLARYGRAMLQSLPEETTQLLIDLCTSTGPLTVDTNTAANTSAEDALTTAASSKAGYLSILTLNRSAAPAAAAEAPTPPSPSIKTLRQDAASVKTARPGSEKDRAGSVHDSTSGPDSRSSTPPLPTASIMSPPKVPVAKPLSPRLYFAHFVDHMEQFVVFLEAVARRRWGQSMDDRAPGVIGIWSDGNGTEESRWLEEDKLDQIAVWNTLLELYLTLPGRGAGERKFEKEDETKSNFKEGVMRDKAMRVLRSSNIPYDPTHALILCSTHGYTRGLVLLWEKAGMYEDIVRFWIDRDRAGTKDASRKVVEALMQYGAEHPHLYPLVLRYLTSTPELLTEHEEDVRGILEHIVEEKIMPPLGVIQVLSRNSVASVGLVKEWLMGRIKDARQEIENDQELTNSYRLETAAKLKQVQELSDTETPKVFHVTRCATCQGQLDLPSVHFMCNHSYHQRCIAEHETECPICAQEHGYIREIRINNEKLADQHDLFLSEVQESGFDAIATAFSRGVLNVSKPEETT